MKQPHLGYLSQIISSFKQKILPMQLRCNLVPIQMNPKHPFQTGLVHLNSIFCSKYNANKAGNPFEWGSIFEDHIKYLTIKDFQHKYAINSALLKKKGLHWYDSQIQLICLSEKHNITIRRSNFANGNICCHIHLMEGRKNESVYHDLLPCRLALSGWLVTHGVTITMTGIQHKLKNLCHLYF